MKPLTSFTVAGESFRTTLPCFGACRTPRDRRRTTRHFVRPVLINGRRFAETTCTACNHVSYMDFETCTVGEIVRTTPQ
jgi:hypothetical protein